MESPEQPRLLKDFMQKFVGVVRTCNEKPGPQETPKFLLHHYLQTSYLLFSFISEIRN